MTLVNVVPQVVPDPKTGVSGMGTFVGGSNPFPAPCVVESNFNKMRSKVYKRLAKVSVQVSSHARIYFLLVFRPRER